MAHYNVDECQKCFQGLRSFLDLVMPTVRLFLLSKALPSQPWEKSGLVRGTPKAQLRIHDQEMPRPTPPLPTSPKTVRPPTLPTPPDPLPPQKQVTDIFLGNCEDVFVWLVLVRMIFKEHHIDIYIYKLLMWDGQGAHMAEGVHTWDGAGAAHNATQNSHI